MPKTFFTTGSTISDELALTRENDLVSIEYIDAAAGEISLKNFDNLEIGSVKDSVQVTQEQYIDSVKTQYIANKGTGVMDDKWSKMTAKEKQELLNKK